MTNWTHSHVNILKQWKAKTFIYLWLHTYSMYYYDRLNDLLTYPILIISAASAATIFTTDSNIANILVGILTLFNALLTSMSQHLNPGILLQQHCTMNKRYMNLIRNIDTCLSLSEDMRPHPILFIERIGVEIDNLGEYQLEAPSSVIATFEKKYGQIEKLLYCKNIHELLRLEMANKKLVKSAMTKSQVNLEFINESALSDEQASDQNNNDVVLNMISQPTNERSSNRTSSEENEKQKVAKSELLKKFDVDIPKLNLIEEVPVLNKQMSATTSLKKLPIFSLQSPAVELLQSKRISIENATSLRSQEQDNNL